MRFAPFSSEVPADGSEVRNDFFSHNSGALREFRCDAGSRLSVLFFLICLNCNRFVRGGCRLWRPWTETIQTGLVLYSTWKTELYVSYRRMYFRANRPPPPSSIAFESDHVWALGFPEASHSSHEISLRLSWRKGSVNEVWIFLPGFNGYTGETLPWFGPEEMDNPSLRRSDIRPFGSSPSRYWLVSLCSFMVHNWLMSLISSFLLEKWEALNCLSHKIVFFLRWATEHFALGWIFSISAASLPSPAVLFNYAFSDRFIRVTGSHNSYQFFFLPETKVPWTLMFPFVIPVCDYRHSYDGHLCVSSSSFGTLLEPFEHSTAALWSTVNRKSISEQTGLLYYRPFFQETIKDPGRDRAMKCTVTPNQTWRNSVGVPSPHRFINHICLFLA